MCVDYYMVIWFQNLRVDGRIFLNVWNILIQRLDGEIASNISCIGLRYPNIMAYNIIYLIII